MKNQTWSFSITGKLLLAFILLPLVELTLLVQLYQRTSFFVTVLIVVATGMLGVSLARQQGLSAWMQIHQQLAQGRNPSSEIINGVMILIAGAFLMTPGILTDGVGFALLMPWIRGWLRQKLGAWFRDRTIQQFGGTWSDNPFAGSDIPPQDETADEQPSVRVVDPGSSGGTTSDQATG